MFTHCFLSVDFSSTKFRPRTTITTKQHNYKKKQSNIPPHTVSYPLRYETVPRQLQMRKPTIPPLYKDEQPSPGRRLEPKRQLKPPLGLMLPSALPDQLPKIKGESKRANIYYLFNPVAVSIKIHLQHNSSRSPLPGEHYFTSRKEVQNFSCKL